MRYPDEWQQDSAGAQRFTGRGWEHGTGYGGEGYGTEGAGYGSRPEWRARAEGRGARWGPYAGVGPRGYQRRDERIHEDVCERLAEDGQLDASDVEVRVANGEVTLEGTVPSRWAKRAAEDLADAVAGVRDVHNRLRIVSRGGEASGGGARAA